MKNFNHTDAESLSQAAGILKDEQNNARIIAGGTDLLSVLKHKLEPDYPETIVNIKSIDGLDRIEEDEDGLKIGATAKLCDIASSPLIREEYGALADAARSVATPDPQLSHHRRQSLSGSPVLVLPLSRRDRRQNSVSPKGWRYLQRHDRRK